MDLSLDDTIAAIASAPGSGQRGIVRISGKDSLSLMSGWFEPEESEAWKQVQFAGRFQGRLNSCSDRAPLTVAAHTWPGHRSYTGQPLVELHLLGSPPLLERVLSEVQRRGARLARPGEFTLRAFLAGKLDLLQAEAVLGVIDAHDHLELQTALSQLAGGLSGRLSELRRDLLELLADLEAGLDFIEEDIEFVTRCEVLGRTAAARAQIEELLQQSAERMQSRVRPRVVLAGLPNAGKSTLFNRLASGGNALVSSEPGTTRDYLQETVECPGMRFDLIDTAGRDEQVDAVSTAARQFQADQCRTADLVLWCSAAFLSPTAREQDDHFYSEVRRESRQCFRIQTMSDDPRGRVWAREKNLASDLEEDEILEISAITGQGLETLLDQICHSLSASRRSGHQWLGMTAARCRESLELMLITLQRAEESAGNERIGEELIAVDVREALEHLGQILGAVYTDDILDRVFSKFCIGK